jgi:hypothetical protein
MSDARTYRRFAEQCQKLADEAPDHRAKLLEMAAQWAYLAEKAVEREHTNYPNKPAGESASG